MTREDLCDILSEVNEMYVKEAHEPNQKVKKRMGAKWLAVAACLCLLIAGGFLLNYHNEIVPAPEPEQVQISNPMFSVESVEEMEKYLDFGIPVLDKEVEAYTVFVVEQYPVMGQVSYMDGSVYRVQYGTGDISGIYGGNLLDTQEIDGVSVQYYEFQGTFYAIWEQDGFTFSYTMSNQNDSVMEELISLFEQKNR